ncbi:MAG TPA: hypothetical protein VGQ36_20625 [Thermoanaerobaculia bacterium]|jgi:hypothetical protein|nr:hypothetical protein [Thermoanaerobaculia bacterium]
MRFARTLVAVVSLLLLIPGCATSSASAPVEADLRIEQLPDAGFAVEERGAVSIAYQLTVRNRSTDAITLRKIEMQTVRSSPYTLRKEPVPLNETIEPGQEGSVTFTMWSYPREQRSKVRGVVWASGIVYFDTAKGSVKKAFTQSFREP